jgi:hypothetical protein
MPIKYTDYDGPQGDFAVIGGCTKPIDDAAVMTLAQNAMALAVGTQAGTATVAEPAVEAALA